MSLIIFSHANSFPLGTYGVLLRSLRARGHQVRGVDRFGHDPRYPVSSNWPKPWPCMSARVAKRPRRVTGIWRG